MHQHAFGGRNRRARTAFPTRDRRFSLEPLEERLVFSGASELLLDVNTTVDDINTNPVTFVPLNGYAYFASRWGGFGGLWRTDGTPDGTTLVRELDSVDQVYNISGVLYFAASDLGTGNRELWKSDGTREGTTLVKEIRAGALGSAPSSFTNVNGTLYFSANDGVNGVELWKSDGTETGTQMVADVRTGTAASTPRGLFNYNGLLLFSASSNTSAGDLWRTDGTAAGTFSLTSIAYGNTSPRDLLELNGKVFFTTIGLSGKRELWNTDGTTAGTARVGNLELTNDASYGTLVNVNGYLYFAANDGANGSELWRTDGTAAGTQLVKDILVGGNSSPANFLNVGGTLYFAANDGVNGVEIWKSDGTADGTQLVKNVSASGSSNPANLINAYGTLYFLANDGVNGVELWKSDGTADGTTLVADIAAGAADSAPMLLTTFAEKLIFRANDGVNGVELWSSDGTAAGTFMLKDIYAGAPGSGPWNFATLGDKLLFDAQSIVEGIEPWVTDGTAAGTMMLKDIARSTLGSNPQTPVNVNGIHYFVATDGEHGAELWRTDGTAAGTSLVADVRPGSASSSITEITNVNGVAYFVANDGIHGAELWRTDGTAAGTVLVRDVQPGLAGSEPTELTNAAGILYFSANDGANGRELWRTDGTAAGTTLAADLAPGTASSNPVELTVMDGSLYYAAGGPSSFNTRLMRVDLSTPSQAPVDAITDKQLLGVSGLAATENRLFFYAREAPNAQSLWSFNPTDGASVAFTPTFTTPFRSTPPFRAWDDSVAFFVDSPSANAGLWRTDGTAAGTYKLAPMSFSGVISAIEAPVAFANGLLFFNNRGANNVLQLWQSDGTAAGTVQISGSNNIALSAPSPFSSGPKTTFAVVGDWLYFSSRSQQSSFEYNLYRTQGTSTGVMLVSDDAWPNLASTAPLSSLTAIGDDLFMAASLPTTGVEPRILRAAEVDKSGDYNGDGRVDGADFLAWQRSFGTRVASPGQGADGTGNGRVNANDLIVWKENFGRTAPIAPTTPAVETLASLLAAEPAESIVALDAAFASDGGGESESRSAGVAATNERPDAPPQVGAAAIALRDATAVASHGRPTPADNRRHERFAPATTGSTIPALPLAYRRGNRDVAWQQADAASRQTVANTQAWTAAFDELNLDRLAPSLAGR